MTFLRFSETFFEYANNVIDISIRVISFLFLRVIHRLSVVSEQHHYPTSPTIESMGIEMKRPIEVRVDNLGAIFMANNISISPRTKHVDVRYRFITELIDNGLIEVKFVKT